MKYALSVNQVDPFTWVYRLRLKGKSVSVVVGTATLDKRAGEFVVRDLFYKIIKNIKFISPIHPTSHHIIMHSLKEYLNDILESLDDDPFKEVECTNLSLIPMEPHTRHRNS